MLPGTSLALVYIVTVYFHANIWIRIKIFHWRVCYQINSRDVYLWQVIYSESCLMLRSFGDILCQILINKQKNILYIYIYIYIYMCVWLTFSHIHTVSLKLYIFWIDIRNQFHYIYIFMWSFMRFCLHMSIYRHVLFQHTQVPHTHWNTYSFNSWLYQVKLILTCL